MPIGYEELLPEILPLVPGCPDSLIENTIRSAVIELCQKSEVYQIGLDPVSTFPNMHEYDLEAPRETSVQKILWVTHQGRDLEPVTTTLLEQRLPRWRNKSEAGVPQYFVQQTAKTFWLAPVPAVQKINSTIVRAVLKPTFDSKACDTDVMNDYRDTIINGALFRLLRMPNKEWSDLPSAAVYGQLFTNGIEDAERRARKADTAVTRRVKYGGTSAGAWRTRGRRYGKGG